jgi:hypothetical protein
MRTEVAITGWSPLPAQHHVVNDEADHLLREMGK